MEPQRVYRRQPPVPWSRLWAALLVTTITILYLTFHDLLTLEHLAAREAELRILQHDQALLVYGIAFIVYVTVTGLSLPGAAVLTLVCGWLFGFWRGLVFVSLASTTGAMVAFLLSRYLLRASIQQRYGERLVAVNQAFQREGAFYLFLLRLIPAVPFFVINVVMGLTPIKARTYWWVSQIGMLPGTAAYVYAGASVPSLAALADKGLTGVLTPRMLAAFALLGILPLLLKKIMPYLRPPLAADRDAPWPPTQPPQPTQSPQ